MIIYTVFLFTAEIQFGTYISISFIVIQYRHSKITEQEMFKTNHEKKAESCTIVDFLIVTATCQKRTIRLFKPLLINWYSICVLHNTLFSMNVTDTNCLNTIWTLPRSGSFQVSNILTALNLRTLYSEVRKLCCHWHSISVCVYTQRYSAPRGYCCHLRGRGKIIALFENGIKIAKLWWASKYEHWSTEDSNSACTQTVKEYFLSYLIFTPKYVEWNI